jgi:DMSO reductase anchor subunit
VHPAFSVIFFTVASGAGFGLFALLFLADALKLGGGLTPTQVVLAGVAALVLVVAGLTSSLFHLANPKNAWRAFSRFRTSWLSREGVFSVLFFPFAVAYLGLTWLDLSGFEALRLGTGAIATLLAWITVFSTGMIYGCLKTIRQWNTPLVPASYLALGHFSGALLLLVLVRPESAALHAYLNLVMALLIAAALLKAIYYYWIAEAGVGSTINTATGFTRAQVKLLDAGHTHGTFLTQEFGFQIARRYALALKAFVFAAAFVLPLLALLGAFGQPDWTLAMVSTALVALGLVVERWLFFAEARHVVNLYHGAQRC